MLEAKYFRDYKHSYMILQCMEDAVKSYQCKLLTSGRIGEILRCSLRHVNGMTYFYYDISSRTTLESLYKGRQMTFSQVRELFEQLYAVHCRLGDNFMEEARLVLLPAYIYYDFTYKKYIGLYYPDYETDNPYEALMDFLLEHIDGEDECLADCLYQIYERAQESGFSLWDALQILGKPGELEEKPVEEEKEAAVQKEEIPFYAPGKEAGLWEEKEKEHVNASKKSPFYPFLMAVSVLGVLGIGYVYVSFTLAEEEMLILFGCGVLMSLCFLAGLIGTCRRGKGRGRGKAKEENERYIPEEEVEHFSSTEMISLDQVLSKDMDSGFVMPKRETRGIFPAEQEEYGNTVFFDSAKLTEYKLYALDKRNKRHIELIKFPFTVGKMAGCVDCVLSDDSVSRIHARFEKTGDVIQMTDMNSTNGTYRNGLRLQPQETVEIEPGDEIRLGNLRYCYR